MANLTSTLLVRLRDGVSGPARAAATSLRGIGAAARSVSAGGLLGAQQRLGGAITANSAKMDAMHGRLLEAAAGAYMLKRALTAPISAAIDFETKLEDISQKTKLSGKDLKDLGKQLQAIARQTNRAGQETADTFDVLMGLGLGGKTDAENVTAGLKMLPALNKATVAFRASGEDVAKAGQAVFANLKVPADQVMRALDAMASSANDGAFELKDMARYMPAITSMAANLGVRGVKGVADIAAGLQVMRQGAGDAEEAARNMVNVLQKADAPATRKNFAKFGINSRKELEKGLKAGKSPLDVMVSLTKAAMKKGARITDLFEDLQVQKGLLALIADTERYHRIRDAAVKASGLVEEAFASRIKTSQGAMDRYKGAIQNMQIALGTALMPTIADLADRLATVAHRIADFADANPQLTSSIVALTAGLIGLRIALIGLQWAGLMAKGGLLSIGAAAVIPARAARWMVGAAVLPLLNGLTFLRGICETVALRFMLMSAAFRAGSIGIGGLVAGTFATMGRAMLMLLNPMALLRGAFVVLKWAMLGLPLAAIAAAGTWIYNNWSGIKELFAGMADGFMKGLGPAAGILAPVVDLAKRLYDAVTGLLGPLSASNSEWRSWGETIGGSVAAGVNAIASGLQTVVSFFASAYEKAVALGNTIAGWNPFGGGGGAPAAHGPHGETLPKRAAGGHVTRGSTYLVGERRPELFSPNRDGYVHKRPGMGGAGSSVAVNQTFYVSGASDPAALVEKVKQAVRIDVAEVLRGAMSDVGLKLA